MTKQLTGASTGYVYWVNTPSKQQEREGENPGGLYTGLQGIPRNSVRTHEKQKQ